MKNKLIAPVLKKWFLSGIRQAFVINFFVFMYIMLASYSIVLRSIDIGLLYSGILGLVVFLLMRTGKIKGYYMNDYKNHVDAIHMYSILFFNSLMRLMVIIPIDYYNHTGENSHRSWSKIASLWTIDPVKIIVLAVAFIFFYSVFLMKKDVLITEFHGIVGKHAIDEMTPVERNSKSNAQDDGFQMLISKPFPNPNLSQGCDATPVYSDGQKAGEKLIIRRRER